MADNLQTFAAICAGGLVTNVDPITQSSQMPGSAISLINMEPSLEGGYRRISGFSNSYGTMPGEGKVLGLTVNGEINQGIFAARKPETGSNYFHFYNNHYTVVVTDNQAASFTIGETITSVTSSSDATNTGVTATVISKTANGTGNSIVLDLGKLPTTIHAAGNVLTGATSSHSSTVVGTPTVIGWTAVDSSFVADDTDGVCAAQTTSGAANLTLNGALADGGAINFYTAASLQPRKLTITGLAGNNNSGVTFTITGTNSLDVAQTEAIAGPNGAVTVSSTKYFKTITQIAAGGAVTGNITAGSGAGQYRPTNPSFTDIDIVRFSKHNWSEEVLILTDGINQAAKYNGTDYIKLSHEHAPATPKFSSAFANHLFLAGDATEPFNLYFSAPLNDIDFDPANGAGVINVGFVITQIIGFRNQLYIFGQNAIKRLSGDNFSNFIVESVTNDLGCVASDTVIEFGGDILFLGPDGLRPVSGTSRIGDVELETVSKEIQKTFESYSTNEDIIKLKAVVVRRKSQFRLFFEQSSSLSLMGSIRKSPTAQSTFEYSQLVGIDATAVASGYIGQFEFIIHGDSLGKIHRQETGNSFNGADILSVYQTPYYFMQDTDIRKMFYKVKTFLRTEGITEVALGISYNFGDSDIPTPSSFNFITANAAVYYNDIGTTYDEADIYDGNPSPIKTTSISGSGDSISLTYVTNNTSPSHTIQAVTVTYGLGDRR